MKTGLKIAAFTLAVILIVGVLWFANALVGNPISKALAENTAKKYLKENYKDTDYELEEVTYSFKDGYYHAYVSSPSSIDTHFTLMINGFGKLSYDNFDYVTSGWNTAERLDKDYRGAVDDFFASMSFPYNAYIAYGELIFVSSSDQENPTAPDYALITEELTVDAYYDVNKLGAQSGKLTVYIYDDNVSVERLAEVLLGIRECIDNAGIGFYVIDCVIEYPRDEEGFADYGRVEVIDFLYSDIYEEGLVARVTEANEEAGEFFGVAE